MTLPKARFRARIDRTIGGSRPKFLLHMSRLHYTDQDQQHYIQDKMNRRQNHRSLSSADRQRRSGARGATPTVSDRHASSPVYFIFSRTVSILSFSPVQKLSFWAQGEARYACMYLLSSFLYDEYTTSIYMPGFATS